MHAGAMIVQCSKWKCTNFCKFQTEDREIFLFHFQIMRGNIIKGSKFKFQFQQIHRVYYTLSEKQNRNVFRSQKRRMIALIYSVTVAT